MINSVTGPIEADRLGFTLMHEHIMVSASGMYRSYPDLLGPNRFERAVECLKEAKAGGIDTMVDATTFDLGRDPELLRAVSEASGVNIINVTGWWLDVPRFIRHVSPRQMAREFVRDIEEGFRGTDVKAGVLKCAADFEGRHAGTRDHEPRRGPRAQRNRRPPSWCTPTPPDRWLDARSPSSRRKAWTSSGSRSTTRTTPPTRST